MSMNRNDDSAWHLDKKVPLAMIFAILVQTAGAFWWASNQDARLAMVERQLQQASPQAASSVERIIRVEEKVGSIKEDIADLKQMVRRIPLLATPPDRQ